MKKLFALLLAFLALSTHAAVNTNVGGISGDRTTREVGGVGWLQRSPGLVSTNLGSGTNFLFDIGLHSHIVVQPTGAWRFVITNTSSALNLTGDADMTFRISVTNGTGATIYGTNENVTIKAMNSWWYTPTNTSEITIWTNRLGWHASGTGSPTTTDLTDTLWNIFGPDGRRTIRIYRSSGGTTLQSIGDSVAAAVSSGATASAADSAQPNMVNWPTSAASTSGGQAGYGNSGSTTLYRFNSDQDISGVIRMVETNAVRYFFGISSASFTNTLANADPSSADLFGMRYDDAISPFLYLVTKDASTITATASTIRGDTATKHVSLRYDAGNSVVMYIDGVAAATNTTHLPTTTAFGRFIFGCQTSENVTKNARLNSTVAVTNP